MAKLTVGKGISQYTKALESLGQECEEMCGRAIFEGAAIIADAIKAEISSMTVYANTEKGKKKGLNHFEREGLIAGLGISKMQNDNGTFNVKIGEDGYNAHKTEKYPNGHPNAMIAHAVERGTSFMPKNPVFTRATKAYSDAAEKAMGEELDKQIEQTMKKA